MFSSFNFGDHSLPAFTQFVKKTTSNIGSFVKYFTEDSEPTRNSPTVPIADSLQSHFDGEIVFCKNNVCVHTNRLLSKSASNANMLGSQLHGSASDLSEQHCPGYLCIQEREDAVLGRTLILHWTPNALLFNANKSTSVSKNSSNSKSESISQPDPTSVSSTNLFPYRVVLILFYIVFLLYFLI